MVKNTTKLFTSLQPPHHLLHAFLPDIGINLGGGDALVAQQGLDVHQFRAGVEQVQVSGISMTHNLCMEIFLSIPAFWSIPRR